MLKRFLCGAAITAVLCGSAISPVQADELYIRNKLFKDAYFMGSTTYVPVDGFLKAVNVPWSLDGPYLVLGQGDSPQWSPAGDKFVALRNGEQLDLDGIVRDGRMYVSARELAEFVGYDVIYNSGTGVIDVVKGRFTNASDDKAADEVRAARQAEAEKRNAAWQARVEKARADRKAKSAGESDDDELEATADGGTLSAKGDPDQDPTETKSQKIDGKDDKANESYESEKPSGDVETSDKPAAPPAKAELVVLSTDAAPNTYTGDVVVTVVLQNQGNAKATNVKSNLVVIGPDSKEWIKKTLHHGPLAPDERWEIVENYTHRLKSAMPRGAFDIKVTPSYDSEATGK